MSRVIHYSHTKETVGISRRMKKPKEKSLESPKVQGCVASISNEGEILYSKAITIVEGKKPFADV